MSRRASGEFDVKLAPQAHEEGIGDPGIGRMALDKQFHGELDAVSKGQMLALRTGTEGSAGYVAMEWVVGTLGGRTGSFGLQHRGVMNRGKAELLVSVVPDSGTGQLAGIDGQMRIIIEGGKHFYEFDYAIAEPAGE